MQRDFAGQKKTNARGDLADYIRDEWLPSNGTAPAAGFLPAFILYFPETLEIEDGTAHIRSKGIFVDGESRGEALLINLERLGDADYDRLVERPVAVHIIHGIRDPKVIAKYFADVNGKGVGVNPNLVVMSDYTDPFAEITKRVFDELGIELETRQRQVSARSNAVLTGLQARTMVAAVAKGVAAVQYGSKPIPAEEIDLDTLKTTAGSWLAQVFETFEPDALRDKNYILRATPVSSSLGALGKGFFDGDSEKERVALEVLADQEIDWTVGEHWATVAGRVNPNTGRFAIGGGKEYAYASYRALTEPESDIGQQIRGGEVVTD